jgi:hypothetical protein
MWMFIHFWNMNLKIWSMTDYGPETTWSMIDYGQKSSVSPNNQSHNTLCQQSLRLFSAALSSALFPADCSFLILDCSASGFRSRRRRRRRGTYPAVRALVSQYFGGVNWPHILYIGSAHSPLPSRIRTVFFPPCVTNRRCWWLTCFSHSKLRKMLEMDCCCFLCEF